ncbi:NYN domain-containing protein, partial [Streptomyces sp. NRRL B-24572]|uniref:NYN domain-containing protein n=1 Tax=Streptomyces sp. NRRL B-24572 TaxID=1962156 RepID=UPI00211AFC93
MEHVDRCVVLVDAGYLLGAAASLLAGEPARSRITVDHAGLIQQLRQRAEAETALPLLRIYWFDGAPDRVPQPEHRRLRVMPRVTVRLGALTRSDGRWAQKGVDAAMHTELTELARNRACSDIVLVTGDGDLLPGLMSAKEHGVAGDEHDVGAGPVPGELGQLGVHGRVDALLRPASVAPGQGAEPDGDPGHHAQP